jgi:hypothetical protein
MAHDDYLTGWAVRDAQGVKLKTVSDTRRAAIVNWLVTECQVLITNAMPDDVIERQWETWRGEAQDIQVRVYAVRACGSGSVLPR